MGWGWPRTPTVPGWITLHSQPPLKYAALLERQFQTTECQCLTASKRGNWPRPLHQEGGSRADRVHHGHTVLPGTRWKSHDPHRRNLTGLWLPVLKCLLNSHGRGHVTTE